MKHSEFKLELFWHDLPTEKENALSYAELTELWGTGERGVRMILHELSSFDNGDNYILIRSSSGKGFYKTDDPETLEAFRRECLNKGKSLFAPVRKINRVLAANGEQFSIENNLRVRREMAGLKQTEVCARLSAYDFGIDCAMLSKMENGVCLPTPYQLLQIAKIYGCAPAELVRTEYDI